jgi:ketosteroid isomerase-like protein
MSQSQSSNEFVAELREAYAAFNRGDIDSALKPFDSRIEWSEPAEFPGGGTYHGLDGVKRYLTQSKAGIAEGTSEPEQFVVVGNRVVVLVHVSVRRKGSDAWHEVRIADVYTVEDGKAIQMKAFADQHEALRWAGAEDRR